MDMAEENTTRSAMDKYGHSGSSQCYDYVLCLDDIYGGRWQINMFLTDRWLHGQNIADLALTLFALVPKSLAKKRTIQEALENHILGGRH
jgi:hypothetical protein